ncbi:MAG: DUF1501 domain-containing protein [Polyangiaceae bacterium]|nr:DUF1501 domain-containing protein [Polyangiaceae bacterium]
MQKKTTTRRHLIQGALLGAGALGLRSLATGLPSSFLSTGSMAHASEPGEHDYIILSHAGSGDPLNAGAPGTYVDGVEHNPSPLLAATDCVLGNTTVQAAKPWSELSADLRERMTFIHHRTYTNAHPEMPKVLAGHGAVTAIESNTGEMLPSALSSFLGDALGTIQKEPITIGNTRLTYEGRPLDLMDPKELKSLFNDPESLEGSLRALRDAELDRIYSGLRESGTAAQKAFLDRFALGREQARQIGADLGALLERVPLDEDDQNGGRDQVLTAVALLKLNIAPVVSVYIPFGGDNHGDSDLSIEATETVSGVATIQFLWDELKAAGLHNRTTFASMNVFGRTLLRNSSGGRNHNGDHHAMCLFGPRVKGGVIGGIERSKKDFQATPIDSSSGAALPDGDIAPEESLESAMRTLGAAAGMGTDMLDSSISGGKQIEAALVAART